MEEEHAVAIQRLRDSGLARTTQREIFEIYLEDYDDNSMETALEKLDTAIEDSKGT